MTDNQFGTVAILYAGDYETRQNGVIENHRLVPLFHELTNLGVHVEPAVYNDTFCDEVRRQLMRVNVVLVWMNPIQDGCDRSILDSILRDVAATGVYVSAHPDVILKMGTKEVLYLTRDMEWGCHTRMYCNMDQLRKELPISLASGKARVLKQYRGNGGDGVWKVELANGVPLQQPDSIIRVRHAKKGSIDEDISLHEFLTRCEQYFTGEGRIIDQAYQERLPEGMVRCYMVHDKIVGFGHQAVNALYPTPAGASPGETPQPGPRLYHPPDMPKFQMLKNKVEQDWVPSMQRLLDISTESLPILWDCDFLLGPKRPSGEDTYVLCEINVSSIAPFPESAPPYIAKATLARLQAARQ